MLLETAIKIELLNNRRNYKTKPKCSITFIRADPLSKMKYPLHIRWGINTLSGLIKSHTQRYNIYICMFVNNLL